MPARGEEAGGDTAEEVSQEDSAVLPAAEASEAAGDLEEAPAEAAEQAGIGDRRTQR